MKIMVAHDCSGNAQSALDGVVEMFKSMKPEIILVSVVEVPLDASVDSEEIFNQWREKRRLSLRGAAAGIAANGLEVDVVFAVGNPREMLLKAANDKNPDMLVVGKRDGGKFSEMLRESVSAYLIHHAKCPVLVFH